MRDGGSAVDAVLAGFLAAAAFGPGVLLAPTGAIVAGPGAGVRVFDGRAVQAGHGAKRPRGLRPEDAVPMAARVAAPRTPAMLPLLHAYGATKTLAALGRLGRMRAKKELKGEPSLAPRLRLLEAMAQRGPRALATSDVARPLLQRAGPVAGGTLTEDDLRHARPGDEAGRFLPFAGDTELAVTPWPPPPAAASRSDRGANRDAPGWSYPRRAPRVVVAADLSGLVAGLGYVPDPDGVAVPELGVTLARDGEPVRRGVPRVTPGTPCAANLPVGVMRRRRDGWHAAVGITGARTLTGASPPSSDANLNAWLEAWVAATDAPDPSGRERVGDLPPRISGVEGLAVTSHRGRVRVVRVAPSTPCPSA